MYQTTIYGILETMERYGGSFVRQLALLYRRADEVNRAKLEATFQEYFLQYDKIASRDDTLGNR
jgi:hypothetical protein